MPYEPKYRYASLYDLATDAKNLIYPEKGENFWHKLWGDKEFREAATAEGNTALLAWVQKASGTFDWAKENNAVTHLGFLLERGQQSTEFAVALMGDVATRAGGQYANPDFSNWCWAQCKGASVRSCPERYCVAFKSGVKHHHHTKAEDVAHPRGPRKQEMVRATEAGKNVLGHGSYNELDDEVIVPPNVTINFWTPRDKVLNKLEQYRAIIQRSAPVDVKGPGSMVENLQLSPLKPGEGDDAAHATDLLENHFQLAANAESLYLCADSTDSPFRCAMYLEAGNNAHHPDCTGILGPKGPMKDIIAKGGVLNFWTCREKFETTPQESDPVPTYNETQLEFHQSMVEYVQSLLKLRTTNPVLAFLEVVSKGDGYIAQLEQTPIPGAKSGSDIRNGRAPRVDQLPIEPVRRLQEVTVLWNRIMNLEPHETDNLLRNAEWITVYSELCDRRDRAVYAADTFRPLIAAVQACAPETTDEAIGIFVEFAALVESYFFYPSDSQLGRNLMEAYTRLAALNPDDEAWVAAVASLGQGLDHLLQPTPTEADPIESGYPS